MMTPSVPFEFANADLTYGNHLLDFGDFLLEYLLNPSPEGKSCPWSATAGTGELNLNQPRLILNRDKLNIAAVPLEERSDFGESCFNLFLHSLLLCLSVSRNNAKVYHQSPPTCKFCLKVAPTARNRLASTLRSFEYNN